MAAAKLWSSSPGAGFRRAASTPAPRWSKSAGARDWRRRAGDLFEALAAAAPEALGAVVSFHVIEHLPAESLDRLVRLAWARSAPGGVLILETPNPLSVLVAARNFWLDPTHRRPVHPESLKLSFEQAGFDPVERLDLRPFPERERLPEIAIDKLPEDARAVGHQLNELRDRLDELLFGFQDYAMVGVKPGEATAASARTFLTRRRLLFLPIDQRPGGLVVRHFLARLGRVEDALLRPGQLQDPLPP